MSRIAMICAGCVAGIAVGGVALAPAAGASGPNDVSGTIKAGIKTAYDAPSATVRTINDDADAIRFTPYNLPSGGMCMRLVNHKTGAVVADTTQCWGPTELGLQKTLGTDFIKGAQVVTQVRKASADDSDRTWSGSLYY